MIIKKSKYEDIPKIMHIINEAKNYFFNEQIFQWDKNYPNNETIENDINNHNSFIILDDNNIILGTFTLIIGRDETYDNIYDGSWLTNNLYATIHRLAIDTKYKRKGIANQIIKYCENFCIENNIKSLRIDTHKLNIPMIKLIEKNNFKYCGIIKTKDLSPRVAFEKTL